MICRKRREKDISRLIQAKYTINKNVENSECYIVEFNGPKESLYEGDCWKLRLFLPKLYPYKSPSLEFLNKIYHPNVDFP